jgi:cytochrome c-type biogenesis protein CcmH
MIARLLTLLAVLALALAPAASGAAPTASFNDLEDEVMCDVCNVPLNIAEAPRAEQQRREIKLLIAEGRTKDEIKDELVRRYGPAILASPPSEGFSLVIYIVPIAVVVALLTGLALLLPRWRRRHVEPAPDDDAPDVSAADARRLDDDLARFGA